MEQRCKIELIGITYHQVESNVFALILQEEGGTRRIPIFIGYAEAQAIECKLQDVTPPRPLTHDTMIHTLSTFGISLLEVEIRRLPNGVFAANLLLSDGTTERMVDSRSSDAIALAIRVGAPIYTTEKVLREAGFESNANTNHTGGAPWKVKKDSCNAPAALDLGNMSMESLEKAMKRAVGNEEYEEAARIKEEIDRRRNTDKAD